MTSFAINNASLPGQAGRHALVVDAGRIVATGEGDLRRVTGLRAAGFPVHDVGGRLVASGFVDAHTHLDKALIDERMDPNADTSDLNEMVRAVRALKSGFTVDDVAARGARCLELSLAHGVTAMRTNCETDRFVGMNALEGLVRVRGEWADRIDLQLVAFPQEGWFDSPGSLESGAREWVRRAAESAAVHVGGNVNARLWPSDPERQVDEIFATATAHDADVDLHLDNWDDPAVFTLPYLARKTIEHGWQGRVAVSHIPSLALVSDAKAAETIDLMREAGVHACVLPTRIKLTRVRELIEAGVNLACGTDNLRDPFVRYGDADILKAALLLGQLTGMLAPRAIGALWETITTNPARMLRLPDYGLAVGCAADLVLLDATTTAEAILHQAERVAVFKRGRQVAGRALSD